MRKLIIVAGLIFLAIEATASECCKNSCEPVCKPACEAPKPIVKKVYVDRVVEKIVYIDRPVLVEKVVERVVEKPVMKTRVVYEQLEAPKNYVAVLYGTGPELAYDVQGSTARSYRNGTVGAQYSRTLLTSIDKSATLGLGVQVQTNESVLGLIQIGF